MMAETEAAAPEADVGLVGDGFSSKSSSFEPEKKKTISRKICWAEKFSYLLCT